MIKETKKIDKNIDQMLTSMVGSSEDELMLLYTMSSQFSTNKKLVKRYYDVVKQTSFKSFFTGWGGKQGQNKELAKVKSMNKVNSIQFVFKNGEILNLLKQRGHKLRKAKFQDATAIENKINAYKQSHYEQIITPVHAFIIFEHEKGHNTALKKSYRESFTFDGHNLSLQSTQHPSTVIYENIEIKQGRTILNAIAFVISMILVTMITYAGFIYIYQVKLELQYMKLPPGIDCIDQQKNLQQNAPLLAYQEWKSFTQVYKTGWELFASDMSSRISRQGYLACFCRVGETNGDSPDKDYIIVKHPELI